MSRTSASGSGGQVYTTARPGGRRRRHEQQRDGQSKERSLEARRENQDDALVARHVQTHPGSGGEQDPRTLRVVLGSRHDARAASDVTQRHQRHVASLRVASRAGDVQLRTWRPQTLLTARRV